MTKGATDAEIIIACSDDNMIVIYDRSKRIISSRIESVPGAMNISFHKKTGRVIVTNEGIAQASVYELDTGRLLAELPTGLEQTASS